jgi:hypothetical protein
MKLVFSSLIIAHVDDVLACAAMLVMRCAAPGLGMDSSLQEAEVAALQWLLWWARVLHHRC